MSTSFANIHSATITSIGTLSEPFGVELRLDTQDESAKHLVVPLDHLGVLARGFGLELHEVAVLELGHLHAS